MITSDDSVHPVISRVEWHPSIYLACPRWYWPIISISDIRWYNSWTSIDIYRQQYEFNHTEWLPVNDDIVDPCKSWVHNFCQTNTQRQQADSQDDTAVISNKDAHLFIVLFFSSGSSGFSHKGVGTLPKFRKNTARYSFPFAILVTLATAGVQC